MKDERREFGETEKQQLAFYNKILKERRKNFEQADTQLWLVQHQNQNDMLQLVDSLSEWQSKVKPENANYKVFESNILAVMRIESYCKQLETTSKAAIAEFISERKITERLQSEKRIMMFDYEKQIESLKKELDGKNKEIDFINSSK